MIEARQTPTIIYDSQVFDASDFKRDIITPVEGVSRDDYPLSRYIFFAGNLVGHPNVTPSMIRCGYCQRFNEPQSTCEGCGAPLQ